MQETPMRRRGAAWTGCACLGIVSTLWLASASAHSQVDRARRAFEDGRVALESGRFADARDRFRRSLELAPRSATAFNLAVALRGTGEALTAVSILEALEEGAYGALDPARRREVASLREELSAELGTLVLTVHGPADLEVRLDGEALEAVEPAVPMRVRMDPGAHLVLISAPERETEERRIEVPRGGELELGITLRRRGRGTLVVEGSHAGDRLSILGVRTGTGRLREQLPPGRYEVVVEGVDGRRTSTVRLLGGATLVVRLPGQSEPLVESPWLWGSVAAMVVAGLVVGGLLLFYEEEQAPLEDPVYGVVMTLVLP